MIDMLVVWLHLVAVLIWIGGMLYTLFVLRPSLEVLEDKKPVFMKKIMDKFFPLVWLAIFILLLTGGYKAHFFINFPVFIAKLVIYTVMVINFAYIYFGLYKKLPSAENKLVIMNSITNLIKINFILGLIVIFLIVSIRYSI